MKYKNPDTGQYEGVDMIEEKAVRDIVADDYSPTSPYAVDAYCLYNGDYYRCTTAIQSGEAWNASHWTPTQVSDELVSIQGAVDSIGTSEVANESNVSGATASAALNTLSGAINAITPLDSTPTANSTKGVTSGGVYTALPKEEAVDWFDVNTATVSTNSLFAKRYGKVIVLNGYLTMNGTVAGNGADLGSFSDIAPTATQKIRGFGTYNGGFSVISLSFNSNGHISTQTGSGTFTGVIYLPNTALI